MWKCLWFGSNFTECCWQVSHSYPALVQIMAWCRTGDNANLNQWWPNLQKHTCLSRPQWIQVSNSSSIITNIMLLTLCVFVINTGDYPPPPPSGQNGRHFTDDIFICIFVNESFYILIKISLKFVPEGPIDNNPWFRDNGLVPNRRQAWPDSLTHICGTGGGGWGVGVGGGWGDGGVGGGMGGGGGVGVGGESIFVSMTIVMYQLWRWSFNFDCAWFIRNSLHIMTSI